MVKKKKSWPPMGFVSVHSTEQQDPSGSTNTAAAVVVPLVHSSSSAACRGTCDSHSTGKIDCSCTYSHHQLSGGPDQNSSSSNNNSINGKTKKSKKQLSKELQDQIEQSTIITSADELVGRRTLLAHRRSIRRRANTTNVLTITSPDTQSHIHHDNNSAATYNNNKSCSCSSGGVSASPDINCNIHCNIHKDSSTPPPIPLSSSHLLQSPLAATTPRPTTATTTGTKSPHHSSFSSGIVSRARSLRKLKAHLEGPPPPPRTSSSSNNSFHSSSFSFFPSLSSPPPPVPPLPWPSREGSLHYNPGHHNNNILQQQQPQPQPKNQQLHHTGHHRPLQYRDNSVVAGPFASPHPPPIPVSESIGFIRTGNAYHQQYYNYNNYYSSSSSSSPDPHIPPYPKRDQGVPNLQSQSNNNNNNNNHLPTRTNQKFNYHSSYKDSTNLNNNNIIININPDINTRKRNNNLNYSEEEEQQQKEEEPTEKIKERVVCDSWQSPKTRNTNNMHQPPPPPPEKQPPLPPTSAAEESRSSTDYCRDSHDLTISPAARESLVENMLLSLDRLGSDPLGEDPRVNQFFQSTTSSSSYIDDADLEYVDDEDDDHNDGEDNDYRFGGASVKTPTASTFNNNTKAPHPPTQSSPTTYHYPPHHHHYQPTTANTTTTNNTSPSYVNRDKSLPSTPTQQSSGFDIGRREGHSGFANSPSYSRPETTNTTPFVPAYNVDIYSEAAPTPTISNRDRDRIPPKLTYSATSPTSKLSRKRSNTTKSVKRDKHTGTGGAVTMDDTAKVLLPGQESSSTSNTPLSLLHTNKSNTKPGFFRRVFGSSNKQSSAHDHLSSQPPIPPVPSLPEQAPSSAVQPSVKPPAPPAAAPPPPPPPTTTTTIVSDANHPSRQQTVTKKASGFFRRRKKSMSEVDVTSMPKTPFHHLDVTTPTTPLPPVNKPATSVLSAPDEVQESTLSSKKSGTPGNYVWDNALMNKVTTSPTNKNSSDSQKKPTIRTVAAYDAEPKPTMPLFDSLRDNAEKSSKSHLDPFAANPREGRQAPPNKDVVDPKNMLETSGGQTKPDSVQAVSAKPSSTTLASPKASEPLKTLEVPHHGPLLNDHEDLCNFDSKANEEKTTTTRPSFSTRSSSKDVNIPSVASTLDKTEVPSKASLGPKVDDDESLADKTLIKAPSRNNSTPVVVLQDSTDGPGEIVEPEAGMPDGKHKDEEENFTDEEKEKATKIFEGDEEFVNISRAAAWLGDAGDSALRIRKAYMGMFDWTGINILAALRMLCDKLVLKGETQQVERIMDEMALRWVRCNSSHGFKTFEVVQTITYSILLLNTDLHLADIPQSAKMTRSQFIRNTMGTIKRCLADADVDVGSPTHCVSPNRSQTPMLDERDDSQLTPNPRSKLGEGRSSIDHPRTNRLSFIRGGGLGPRFFDDFSLDSLTSSVPGLDGSGGESGGPFVNTPFTGTMRQWEMVVEAILKDFYASVRLSALPLHGVSSEKNLDGASNSSSLGISGSLRRTPSTVSKSPSEMSLRTPGDRYGSVVSSARSETHPKLGSKWGVRNRSRPRLYPSSFAGSSRTSFEDRMWSPSASSTWSKYSLDKTTASMMSVDSLGAGFGQKDYQQSIGFANALSHAIIREEAGSGSALSNDGDSVQNAIVDEDLEDLSLHGAPWAKEGMVKHKHHLEAIGKKAKNRGWSECFAVVEKGWMRLFLFPSGDKKKSQKGGIVGGGNWMENAESVGSFMLRQTIASALPPPGYSKARPHVLALSLPNGAVHLFQAGTADIVNEWVTTANYWSARLSKEPLVGGVSNVEYGWGNCLDPNLIQGSSRPPTSLSTTRPSFQESLRSSMDHGASSAVRARLPGDKAVIADWNPPSQSMVASNLGEKDQLNALTAYVKNVEAELQKHNELRSAMIIAFTPRHINYSKAMNNWERKSSYLLREIVKFRTYIDALQTAINERQKIACDKETSSEQPEQSEPQTDEPDTIESQGLPEIPTSA